MAAIIDRRQRRRFTRNDINDRCHIVAVVRSFKLIA